MTHRSGPRRRRLLVAGALVAFVAASSVALGIGLPEAEAQTKPRGIDVASWQGNVDWKYWWKKGKRFAFVKATEGTGYRNPYFKQQYNGSYKVGMIRGAYHFALPNRSSGAAQARYFVKHGGGWSADGKTLPGALDIEYNPYGETCYGMRGARMVRWIKDFTTTYKKLTGRDAVIYTTANWWNQCTGSSKAFGRTNPLWVARYAQAPGALPAGWKTYTFWQHTSKPLDQNIFNGSMERLKVLAKGPGKAKPKPPTSSPKPKPTKPKPTATMPKPTSTKPKPTPPKPTNTKPEPTGTKPKPTGTKPSESPKPTSPEPTSTTPSESPEPPQPSEPSPPPRPEPTDAPNPPGGGGGDEGEQLPVTGTQVAFVGAVGVALVSAGVLLFLLATYLRKGTANYRG